tara:strand:+ start:651 stop:1274 length:624 start_codon:yes stop_codon:yes gene_type:complete
MQRKSVVFVYKEEDLSPKSRENKQKHKIQMFHIGNNCDDGVSYGFEKGKDKFGRENQFLFPAIDFGGLTNVRLGLDGKWSHERVEFLPYDATANDVYTAWKRHHLVDAENKMRSFPREVYHGFLKWKRTVPVGMHYGIASISSERTIVPAKTIFEDTNKYFIKLFNGTNESRVATADEINNLYAAVLEKDINTNINHLNMELEYRKI